jgi:hypothetical protein
VKKMFVPVEFGIENEPRVVGGTDRHATRLAGLLTRVYLKKCPRTPVKREFGGFLSQELTRPNIMGTQRQRLRATITSTMAPAYFLWLLGFISVKENGHKIKWYFRVYFRKGKRS